MSDLENELKDLQRRYPALSRQDRFALWFQVARITGEEAAAARSLTGEPGDKGIDALFIDDNAQTVYVTQSKFRTALGRHSEQRNDVIDLARMAQMIRSRPEDYSIFVTKLAELAKDKLDSARARILERGYRLVLYYATTGKVSAPLRREATDLAREYEAEFITLDSKAVVALLKEYQEGVSPPVPTLDLPIQAGGVATRHDLRGIEAWVVSATGKDVADLYRKAGLRIFARNLRGYVGDTVINSAMKASAESDPDLFWYLNNGVTIVCTGARQESSGGKSLIRLQQPQIINGQQTTRVLAEIDDIPARNTRVLVRVIEVPAGSPELFDRLVSKIVRASNSQNKVNNSDFVSNDGYQVKLERDLRNLGYLYVRKRETKSEAKRRHGQVFMRTITKAELATASTAILFDPRVVRAGKDRLFGDDHYEDIFGGCAAVDFLNRYWLMQRVAVGSRGFPTRAYAKWHVLHLGWNELAGVIEGHSREFRVLCETARSHPDRLRALDKAVDILFRAALAFFRLQHGRGPAAIDISNFFYQPLRHDGFATFWASSAGKSYRVAFARETVRFSNELTRLSAVHATGG